MDCHAKTIIAMPSIPQVLWWDSYNYTLTEIMSFMQAQRSVACRCLSYLVYVQDISSEAHSIDSVLVV